MSHWRFAAVFVTCGVVLVPAAVTLGGVGWLAVWPGIDFLLLGVVYGLNRPSWLGKRADGTIAWPARVLFFPYFAFTWTMWHLFRRVTPEAACHLVAPGVYLGRRPLGADLPGEVETVIDLTAEFPRPVFRHTCRVLQVPTLDAQAPSEAALEQLVQSARDGGVLYIHCAAGHGRSALVAAIFLVSRGDAPDLDAAMRQLARSRPAVRLHAPQREAGLVWLSRWRATPR